jgi:prepilin-type N-terminal cleavage/methylation domain-containing protein
MNERTSRLNFASNSSGFTLVELMVSIIIGTFIVFGISRTIQILSENIQVVDDGISLTEESIQFQKDMEFVKTEYPTILFSSGSIFGDAKYGYNIYALEHVSWSGGIIIGSMGQSGALVGETKIYTDSRLFYTRISEVTKNQIKATGQILNSHIDMNSLYRYKGIYPTKFSIIPLNNGTWKIEVITLGIKNQEYENKNISDLLEDTSIMKYNISFIAK